MGRPKAWLPWFGRTLVEHVVAQLRDSVDELIVVTSRTLELPPLDARIVRDRESERGPLAGIRDGLAGCQAQLAFVTSTDAPFLTSVYVEALFAHAEARPAAASSEAAGGRACAPIAEGHVQVLSAVYPVSAAKLAGELIGEGARRPLDLLERLDFERLDAESTLCVVDPLPWQGFNTPGDYLDAVRAIDPAARAEVELLGRAALHADTPRRSLPVGTLGELLAAWPGSLGLVEAGRVARGHLVSLGGRDLVRDLSIPVGPGERVSVIDAQAGG